MGLSPLSGCSPDLLATLDHVWGGDDQIDVARPGTTAAGWRVAERYRIAPTAGRARFVFPATSRQAAAGSLRSFNQLRPPRTRAARAVLGAALSVGSGRLLPDRFDLVADPQLPDDQLSAHLVTRHIAELLERPDLRFAFGVHPQTPNIKPTLQAFAPAGAPAAYIKVGWNDVTRGHVQTEAAALRALAGRLRSVSTPSLSDASRWRDRELLVTAPMPATVTAWTDPDQSPGVEVVREVAEAGATVTSDLAGSAQVARLRAAAGVPGWDPATRATYVRLIDRLVERFGDQQLNFGAWHGDWVPWNIARHGAGILAWDWEQFTDRDVVVGADTLHWHFQVEFVQRGAALGVALARSKSKASAQISTLQEAGAIDAVQALYALELTARYEAMRVAGAGATARFHPQISTELAAIGAAW